MIVLHQSPSEPEGHQTTAVDLTSKARQHDHFITTPLRDLPQQHHMWATTFLTTLGTIVAWRCKYVQQDENRLQIWNP
jgi:hypothetical protein